MHKGQLRFINLSCTLFRYVAVLERDGDSVGMEDLDSLQLELESLLSSVVVRAALGSLSELLILMDSASSELLMKG